MCGPRRIAFFLMKPAANLREIVPGLWAWSSLHEEWNVDFCCCAWKDKGRLVLVDPRSCKDPRQNRESVRRLLGLAFETMTFAHGNPIVQAAKATVQALFSEK